MRTISSLAFCLLAACANVGTIARATPNTRLDAVNQLYATTAADEKTYADQCRAAIADGGNGTCREIVDKAKKADTLAFGALTQANDAYAGGDDTDVALLIGVAEAGVNVFGTYFAK